VLIAVIMLATFFVFQMIGDPVRRILPINATDQQVETYRSAHGFADPLPDRIGRFSRDVVTLKFGESYTTGQPALPDVFDAIPRTFLLVGAALALALSVGVGLGTFAAVNRGGRIDRAVVTVAVSLASLAEFWVGLIFIVFFAVRLGILPTGGYGFDKRLVLPAVTLAVLPIGRFAFFSRNSISNVLDDRHVLYATAMGIPRTRVLRRHVLRNASLPVLALAGTEAARMLVGGAVIVETVFAWPGVGRLYVTAMRRYDLPLVTATLFFATLIVFAANIGLDLLYALLDPRVRYQ
jgi:peptide/nickel transport system permease protein